MRFVQANGKEVVPTPAWKRLPKRLMTEFVFFQLTGGEEELPAEMPEEQQQGGAAAAGASGSDGGAGQRNVRQRTA